jgi:hypothetical protein
MLDQNASAFVQRATTDENSETVLGIPLDSSDVFDLECLSQSFAATGWLAINTFPERSRFHQLLKVTQIAPQVRFVTRDSLFKCCHQSPLFLPHHLP